MNKALLIKEKLLELGIVPIVILESHQRPYVHGDSYDEDSYYDYQIIAESTQNQHVGDNLDIWYGWLDSQEIDALMFDVEECHNGINALVSEISDMNNSVVKFDLRNSLSRDPVIDKIFDEILSESIFAESKHGNQDLPSIDPVLFNREGGASDERFAEHLEIPSENRAKFLVENAREKGTLSWAQVAVEELSEAVAACNQDPKLARKELLQLGAIVIRWIRQLDIEINKNKPKDERINA